MKPTSIGLLSGGALFLMFVCPATAAKPTPTSVTPSEHLPLQCQTTREFVTALEFLRADSDFQLKDREAEAREIAFKVADGCTGSARRFIRVAKTLLRAGANRKDATETALEFARGTDAETDTFSVIFRKAIAGDSLDMDFGASIRIAMQLSKEFKGDLKQVREDFERVVDYCADSNRLGLPRTTCGTFAAAIAQAGQKWVEKGNKGVGKPFIKVFEYLTSEKGPALTTADALRLAKDLVTQGPSAPANFMQAYQYGTASSGLNQPRNEAIAFARKMAALSGTNETEGKAVNPAPKSDR